VTKNRKISRSRPEVAGSPIVIELPPERAFVLHLDSHAQPPQVVAGRVEHVTSGRIAHVSSLREMLAFLADVLGDELQAAEMAHTEPVGPPSRPRGRKHR
jgi:hypothetical protein